MKDYLVSIDDVIKVVDKHTTEDGKLDDDISCILEEIELVYDLDNICNKLQKLKEELHNCFCDDDNCLTTECSDCVLDKAIEIVKSNIKINKVFTDNEYRILLSELSRERKICKEIDSKNSNGTCLVNLVNSIERKIKNIQK